MRGSKAKQLRRTAVLVLQQTAQHYGKDYASVAEDVISEKMRQATRFSRPIRDDEGKTVGYNNFSGLVQYETGMKAVVRSLKAKYKYNAKIKNQ